MGLELIRVERVDPCPTVNPKVTTWTISGHTIEESPRSVQFQTINDLKASICARGKQLERLVWVGWRDSRFGIKDIVTVDLDDSKWQHEGQEAS